MAIKKKTASAKKNDAKNKYKKVTRKFLEDLARSIYNPSTRKFLRLCNGTLQNGPDPTDEDRPMHCGLGELYFAMTGRQPREDHASESRVVELAFELSPLNGANEISKKKAIAAIDALEIRDYLKVDLIDLIENDFEDSDVEQDFRDAIDAIQVENDNVVRRINECGDEFCTYDDYRKRAMAVALQLREAAKLLPV